LVAKGAMQNFKITVETDELVAVPDTTRKFRLNFTTIYGWLKKNKIFSYPIHHVDCLRINEL
jgi:hypothetical protein